MNQHFPPADPFPLTMEGLRDFFGQYPHWTHEAFAQHVGIMPRSLRRILSGERGLGPKVAGKIERKFPQFFREEKAA